MTKLPFAATVASGWPPDAEVGSSQPCLGGWEDPHPHAEPRMWREEMVTSSCPAPLFQRFPLILSSITSVEVWDTRPQRPPQ